MRLVNVSGISSTKVDKLRDKGYLFAEDLVNANAAKVAAIDGCSAKLVANAQQYFRDETDTPLNSINYRCGECGKLYQKDRDSLYKHVKFDKCREESRDIKSIFS